MSFPTTRWSLVAAARDADESTVRGALEELCVAYWRPVYAHVRRRGVQADEAADVTQSFFAMLIERGDVASARQERGRFRNYLLKAVQNHVAKTAEHRHARRRGGGRPLLSLDAQDAESRYSQVPSAELTPEQAYERAWTRELLERTLASVRREMEAAGRGEAFAALAPFLAGDAERGEQTLAAEALGMKPNAFKVALHRLRRQFREALRREVAETLADPADVDDELRHLLAGHPVTRL